MKVRDHQANENTYPLLDSFDCRNFGKARATFQGSSWSQGIFLLKISIKAILLPHYSLWQMGSILHKHLVSHKQNTRYISKTIQKEVVHIYACKIREKLTKQLWHPHSNQVILSRCLRYANLISSQDPHIRACFINLIHLETAKAVSKSGKISEAISHSSISWTDVQSKEKFMMRQIIPLAMCLLPFSLP